MCNYNKYKEYLPVCSLKSVKSQRVYVTVAKQSSVHPSHVQFGLVRKDLSGFSSNFGFLPCIEVAYISHKHREIISPVIFFLAEDWTISPLWFDIALPLICSALHPFCHADCSFLLAFLNAWHIYTKKVPSAVQEKPVQKRGVPKCARNYSFNVWSIQNSAHCKDLLSSWNVCAVQSSQLATETQQNEW